MRKLLLASIGTLLFIQGFSQVLFTYGKKPVTKDEFLYAFDKTPSSNNRKQALKEYLDLYINFRLKVQAALDENLDKEENFKLESENFKRQIADNYFNKQANIEGLVTEAFKRSQRDLLVAHILVEVQEGDTLTAYRKIQEAHKELVAGKSFELVSDTYTTDAATKKNKGVLGNVTVFSLPYEIENLVYALNNGGYSKPYRSSMGYHIFKRLSDRPALGKRKIQQLLIYTPTHFNETEIKMMEKRADSIYQLVMGGADFQKMVQEFGNNYNQYNPQSTSLVVGVGTHDAAFEKQVFELTKKGEVSKPFRSQYGFNIIKLEEMRPVSTDINDATYLGELREAIYKDSRLAEAKEAFMKQWLNKNQPKPANIKRDSLWAFTDSALARFGYSSKSLNNETAIFSFPRQKVYAARWLRYVKAMRQTNPQLGPDNYPALYEDFVKLAAEEYYREHMEDYNKEFARQVREFNEANLLFATMEKNVWNKAASDSAGLQKYYRDNALNYKWQPGVSAIVVTAKTKAVANELKTTLQNKYSNWRDVITGFGNDVMADSSRYENSQLPVKQKVPATEGWISEPEENDNDGSYTFLLVTEVHNNPQQRSFDEARGLVITDYQAELEKKWLASLRKKYPVVINQSVWATVK